MNDQWNWRAAAAHWFDVSCPKRVCLGRLQQESGDMAPRESGLGGAAAVQVWH